MAPRITVAGGANTDIFGVPEGRYLPGDSNPGHVRVSAGGVGRNIAENLSRLGAAVGLVTAFGGGEDTDELAAGCVAAGIDISHSIRVPEVPGSRYLAVLDDAGGLAAAVSDMRALQRLTAFALDPGAFAGADAIVLDTNLDAAALLRATELADGAPVVLDPVSVAKSEHARPVLDRLAALKANLAEATALSGGVDARGAADRLLRAGVERVFITLGPQGVWCASSSEAFHTPALPAGIVNVTGAGDAFTAGVAWGVATGMSLREIAQFGAALSAIALESERTVSKNVSLDAVRERIEEALR